MPVLSTFFDTNKELIVTVPTVVIRYKIKARINNFVFIYCKWIDGRLDERYLKITEENDTQIFATIGEIRAINFLGNQDG